LLQVVGVVQVLVPLKEVVSEAVAQAVFYIYEAYH
tara:strand:+ start:303 stop:407 length:105 start_codon:yes stop_codon:yes gene_type:complete